MIKILEAISKMNFKIKTVRLVTLSFVEMHRWPVFLQVSTELNLALNTMITIFEITCNVQCKEENGISKSSHLCIYKEQYTLNFSFSICHNPYTSSVKFEDSKVRSLPAFIFHYRSGVF